MKVDRNLNLVVPVDRDGITVHVHSAPIRREIFEAYFLPISKTFTAIYAESLGVIAGPRVAALMLRKVATEMGVWEGEAGVEQGLMAEIRRLTNVVAPRDGCGWETFPYQEAVDRQYFDPDDVSEVENAIVFFSAVLRMHRRTEAAEVASGAARLWAAQITSLNSTAFAASLPISTPAESTGATAAASSVPS